jgi:hydrogenase nickel incorporation protein HypA/HybF
VHELAICQALIRQVRQLARERHASRVVAVTLRIGPLAGVEPALIEAAYPLASAGTPAASAALRIERAALRVRCRECGRESEASVTLLACGACGGGRIDILSGDELQLATVELEIASVR